MVSGAYGHARTVENARHVMRMHRAHVEGHNRHMILRVRRPDKPYEGQLGKFARAFSHEGALTLLEHLVSHVLDVIDSRS